MSVCLRLRCHGSFFFFAASLLFDDIVVIVFVVVVVVVVVVVSDVVALVWFCSKLIHMDLPYSLYLAPSYN